MGVATGNPITVDRSCPNLPLMVRFAVKRDSPRSGAVRIGSSVSLDSIAVVLDGGMTLVAGHLKLPNPPGSSASPFDILRI